VSSPGLKLTGLGLPLLLIFLMAGVGSAAGDWIAARFIKRGVGLKPDLQVT
jgi:ACS family hexuronate transporter-like MFS transporter